MWSRDLEVKVERERPDTPQRGKLLVARLQMTEALRLLDAHSSSAAAASLDLALHQLDRELSAH